MHLVNEDLSSRIAFKNVIDFIIIVHYLFLLLSCSQSFVLVLASIYKVNKQYASFNKSIQIGKTLSYYYIKHEYNQKKTIHA